MIILKEKFSIILSKVKVFVITTCVIIKIGAEE